MAHLMYLALGVRIVWDARHMIHGQPVISVVVAAAIVYALAWVATNGWPRLVVAPIKK